jgi:hypothetical protein
MNTKYKTAGIFKNPSDKEQPTCIQVVKLVIVVP